MTTLERLRDKANSLPLTPGVYLMKNKAGVIVYVGKSKKLKNRVSGYFVGNGHTRKTEAMVAQVDDFDYILCDTEIEALTLENVLIKSHTPKYNIRLKDAKSYPYIKVTSELFPKLLVTRERKADKARYFGPYSGISQAYGAMEAVRKIFSLPSCKRSFPADIGKERPCIYKQMGRCIAPCTGLIRPEDYRERIRAACEIFDGNSSKTERELTAEMEAASEAMEFERAALLRDSIRALEKLSEKQKVVADVKVNRDVFALFSSETESVLGMLAIRNGAVIRKNELALAAGALDNPEDAVSLIADYYDRSSDIPRQVLLDFLPDEEDRNLLAEYLTLSAGVKIEVRIPERGEGRAQCDLAFENAKEAARQTRLEGEREDKDVRRLAELLALGEVPKRIEAYDISNIGNDSITASMVVYADGKMKKSDYRTFAVRTTDGANDYGSMAEVLHRRLAHVGDGSPSLGDAPDLILLDGGEAHVHTVRAVMDSMNLEIPLFGMVKDDFHKTRAITDGENEISIATEMNVYAFVYKIQEEAHRFAYKNTTESKSRSLTHSTLESIPGIGPRKAKLLLCAMPLSAIRQASEEDLKKIKGISEKDARAVSEYYRQKQVKKSPRKGKPS